MATMEQLASSSQSRSRIRSSVIVPKVRITLLGLPSGPGTIRQATTVLAWISNPQHRSWTTSIVRSFPRLEGVSRPERLVCVLLRRGQQTVVPGGTQVKLMNGLGAPALPDLGPCQPSPHFHPRWWPSAMTTYESLLAGSPLFAPIRFSLSGRQKSGEADSRE